MPIPQYNVKQTDTGSRSYNVPVFKTPPAPQPKVNPLKNWWNNIVNTARQNAFAPSNTWDTVAPNVPTFNTSTQRTLWDIPYWTPPSVKTTLPQPTYSVFDPFGITQNTGMNMPNTMPNTIPTVYGTNTRKSRGYPSQPSGSALNLVNNLARGQNSPFAKPGQSYPPAGKYGVGQFPQILNMNSWLVASQNPGSSYKIESLAELLARGAVDPWSHDPYEIGGSPYQQGVWMPNPNLPPYNPGGGGGGGWGGSSYYSMPNSPRYKGYGGGYGSGGSPRSARYQGNYGGYGGGYGGYAGGQSQRSAWYGALLQWNI